MEFFRDVAQPGSAHVWGAWGRKFESCHPDQMISTKVKARKTQCLRAFLIFSSPINIKQGSI